MYVANEYKRNYLDYMTAVSLEDNDLIAILEFVCFNERWCLTELQVGIS